MQDVKKASMVVQLDLDDDGTPLCHGERLVEIKPGTWAHPLVVAVTDFLEGKGA